VVVFPALSKSSALGFLQKLSGGGGGEGVPGGRIETGTAVQTRLGSWVWIFPSRILDLYISIPDLDFSVPDPQHKIDKKLPCLHCILLLGTADRVQSH
jgi:hypothetical protein